jgi:hypothetical protein
MLTSTVSAPGGELAATAHCGLWRSPPWPPLRARRPDDDAVDVERERVGDSQERHARRPVDVGAEHAAGAEADGPEERRFCSGSSTAALSEQAKTSAGRHLVLSLRVPADDAVDESEPRGLCSFMRWKSRCMMTAPRVRGPLRLQPQGIDRMVRTSR